MSTVRARKNLDLLKPCAAPHDGPRIAFETLGRSENRSVGKGKQMRLKIIAATFALLPLAIKLGCALFPKDSPNAPQLLGNWGGEHIALAVTRDSATVEYDCARGAIASPILVDEQNNFVAEGVHVQEHGGPVHEREIPEQHPAQFNGRVQGGKMILAVKLKDSGLIIGTFELRLGQLPKLFKCL